jgi:hypothetical protein
MVANRTIAAAVVLAVSSQYASPPDNQVKKVFMEKWQQSLQRALGLPARRGSGKHGSQSD